MKKIFQSDAVVTGLAMFSMFFGAGNIVFPLALGQLAGDKNLFAISGLLITAVGMPFLGLIGMILFNGNYESFMGRMGKLPGFILILLTIALIGPLAGIPRCITLSFDNIAPYLPGGITLFGFSIVAAATIFLFAIKESSIIDILGYVLSPLLLIALGLIMVFGLIFAPPAALSSYSSSDLFLRGITTGYQTMDLLAAIFFASVVLSILREKMHPDKRSDYKHIASLAFKASIIGASLLAIVYLGMSFVSARYGMVLSSHTSQQLLGAIAAQVLGRFAGLVVSTAVALACLTTAITLTVVTADFIKDDLAGGMLGYRSSLLVTLGLTIIVASLKFEGIVAMIAPVLVLCYPAIIVLSALNIAYKLWNVQMVKGPVWATIAITAYVQYGQQIQTLLGF